MTSRILVTGGTGTLGRHVVPRLREAGCTVRVLSRNAHEAADGIEYLTGDLLKNEGIQAAVDGADIIVHCAGGRKGDDAVQDTWLRLTGTDTSEVENLGGWLTTVVARVSLNMLRSRR